MLSCIYIETVFWALFYLTNGPDNCSSESLSKAKTLVILFAALIELNAFSSNEELINNAIKSGEKNYRYLKSEEEKGNLTNSPKWAAGMISKALAANYSNPEKADAVTKRIWPVNTAMCEEVVAIANKLITQK